MLNTVHTPHNVDCEDEGTYVVSAVERETTRVTVNVKGGGMGGRS